MFCGGECKQLVSMVLGLPLKQTALKTVTKPQQRSFKVVLLFFTQMMTGTS